MKLVFILSSVGVVYLMRYHKVVKLTYDREHDTFRTLFLLAPCALLALLVHGPALGGLRGRPRRRSGAVTPEELLPHPQTRNFSLPQRRRSGHSLGLIA